MSKKAVQSYLETALWSSIDEEQEPLAANYSVGDFSKAAKQQAKLEVEAFLAEIQPSIEVFEDKAAENRQELKFDDSDIGHDFWLTRNRHGAGFWDRPEKYGKDLADLLSMLAHGAGERDVYVGDDDELRFDPDQQLIDLRHPAMSGADDGMSYSCDIGAHERCSGKSCECGCHEEDTAHVKTCSFCGRTFTAAEWEALPLVGYQEVAADAFGPASRLELKNCPDDDSTLAIETLPQR